MMQSLPAQELSDSTVRMANMLLRHVLPLYRRGKKGRPELVGSGFLLHHGEDHFLVSAAHVLDEHANLFFYIAPNLIRHVAGRLVRTTLPKSGLRNDDRIDVGVLRLTQPPLPPYLSVGKYPVSSAALKPRALPRTEKDYMIVGFPATKAENNPQAKRTKVEPVSYRNPSAPPTAYQRLQYREQDHLLIAFDRKRCIGPDGRRRFFPEPAGLSGAPVWMLYDHAKDNDPLQTPIVAVVVERAFMQKVLVATDITIVLRLISAAAA